MKLNNFLSVSIVIFLCLFVSKLSKFEIKAMRSVPTLDVMKSPWFRTTEELKGCVTYMKTNQNKQNMKTTWKKTQNFETFLFIVFIFSVKYVLVRQSLLFKVEMFCYQRNVILINRFRLLEKPLSIYLMDKKLWCSTVIFPKGIIWY